MIRRLSPTAASHQQLRRIMGTLSRQPSNDIPHLHVARASLAGLDPPPDPSRTKLIVLTHASALSDDALRASLNARDIPTIAVELTRSLNAIALDAISMVLDSRYNYRMTGFPRSGKSTFALLASRKRRLVVKTPAGGNKFTYRMIEPDPTVTWNEYEIQPQSHQADMRPFVIWDPPSIVSSDPDVSSDHHVSLQAAGCVPLRITEMEALDILLKAIHRHAMISDRAPHYLKKLERTERFTSAEEFRNANPNKPLGDLISACRNGEYGKLLFEGITPKEDDGFIKIHRGKAIVGYNSAALKLFDASIAAKKAQSVNHRKNQVPRQKEQKEDRYVPVERPEYPKDESVIIQYPEHRRTLHCMVCAGFIKRESDNKVFGIGYAKVLGQRYEWMLAYFSRMMEAYGNSSHTKYLMKDSLACTLMRKHGLRSRAAAYKKFHGIPEFPMPNDKRPPFLRSDQPIPHVPRCSRLAEGKSSCYDTHAIRLLDSIPNYQARMHEVELNKEL